MQLATEPDDLEPLLVRHREPLARRHKLRFAVASPNRSTRAPAKASVVQSWPWLLWQSSVL